MISLSLVGDLSHPSHPLDGLSSRPFSSIKARTPRLLWAGKAWYRFNCLFAEYIFNMLFSLVICLLFAPTILRLMNWIRNYKEARGLGLFIVLTPFSEEDAWWLPLRPLFAWVQNLPFDLGSWYVYSEFGWGLVDGRKTTLRLGENFVLCSPTAIRIVTCT